MLLLPLATLRPQGVLRFARCRMSSTAPEQQLESVSELQRSVSSALASAREQAEKASSLINLPQHEAVIGDLESKCSAPDFWDDAAGAEATLRELSEHKAQVEHATSWRNTLDDAEAALQLLPEALLLLRLLQLVREEDVRQALLHLELLDIPRLPLFRLPLPPAARRFLPLARTASAS